MAIELFRFNLLGEALCVCVCFLFFIHLLLNYNKKARLIRLIPGPKDSFIIGNTLAYVVSPDQLFHLREFHAKQFKGIYRFWGYPFGAVALYNPCDVETILSNTKYNEKSVIYNFLKPWLREGLLLSKGLKWRQRRKVLTNAFHFNILSQFWGTLEENSQRLVKVLEQNAGKQVDIVPVLSEYTLQAMCETSMGFQLDVNLKDGRSYKDAIYAVGKLIIERFIRIYLYPDTLFNLTSWGRSQTKHLNTLHNFTKRVINERRKYFNENYNEITSYLADDRDDIFITNRKNRLAMLDLLLKAEKEGQIENAGIQEEVDTFMFEGHDTTASALTYIFMSLANNKMIQKKIFDELQEIFGDSERDATTADLSKMQYIECCIKESLRLYPPVHFISRQINDEVVLSNYVVPAGTLCHILIYDLHRRPDLYDRPLEFDPDRFLPENSVGRHPYAYIPFSAGPRNCIGQRFAMMELKSAVAAVMRKYELFPVTQHSDLEFLPDLVLRNTKPIYVKFVKRQ